MDEDGVSALSWTTHTGGAVEQETNFWQNAPSEIGRISSASSTLKPRETQPFKKRSVIRAATWSIPLVLGVIVLGICWFQVPGLSSQGMEPWGLLALFGGLFSLLGLINLRRHECSFVGEQGIALYPLGKPGTIFLFEKARVLYSGTTRHYTNGIYTGTDDSFTWMDGSGKIVYTRTTNYHSFKEKPHPDETVHFLRASEQAWCNWVEPYHQKELEQSGRTGFPLRSGGGLFLSKHALILRKNKVDTEISQDAFEGFSVNGGYIFIHRTNGKPLEIPYADIGNAQVFLKLTLETLNQNEDKQ